MQLKEFNPDVMPSGRRGSGPKISFQKSGLISINPEAAALLKLKVGDAVKLYQNPTDKEDWYIAKAKGGFQLRSLTGSLEGHLAFSSKALKDMVFESVESTSTSSSCPISAEEVVKVDGSINAHLIITAAIKK